MLGIEVLASRSGEGAANTRTSDVERPSAGALADPFETIFRRMKDRVVSHAPHDAGLAQGRSRPESTRIGGDARGRTKGRESVVRGSIRSGAETRGAISEPNSGSGNSTSASRSTSVPGAAPEDADRLALSKGSPTAHEAAGKGTGAKTSSSSPAQPPQADEAARMEASTSKSAAFEAGTAIVSKASFPGDLPESAKAYQMRGSAESGQADKQVKAGEFGMKLDPALSLESFSTGREALFKMPGSNAAANATSTGRLLDASEFFTGRVVPAQVAPVPQISPEILAARAVGRAVEAGRGQLLDQVVQGVRVAHQGEAIEITVHLRPDFLGRLSIRVLADDAGMRVEIRAENEVVRQLMQDNMADLQQRLSEKGLSFDSFGVFAEAGQNQRDGPEYSFRAQTRDGPEAQQGAAETASEQASGPIPIQGGAMIDCFA